jgi:hypothetical protein
MILQRLPSDSGAIAQRLHNDSDAKRERKKKNHICSGNLPPIAGAAGTGSELASLLSHSQLCRREEREYTNGICKSTIDFSQSVQNEFEKLTFRIVAERCPLLSIETPVSSQCWRLVCTGMSKINEMV